MYGVSRGAKDVDATDAELLTADVVEDGVNFVSDFAEASLLEADREGPSLDATNAERSTYDLNSYLAFTTFSTDTRTQV